jgi:Zn-dependent protease/predicted transcriptional regulator
MKGFGIGRIFGINIRVDWSWLLIFALITWNLGKSFEELHPGWDAISRWGLAALASVLFFASVLAHELAHSLVARARGIPVRSITLFMFGGVSDIEREPDSPLAEFLIAIVGPITSLVLGVGFLMAGVGGLLLDQTVPAPEFSLARFGPASTLFAWLGTVNLLLAVFNMIPGFPLDGGRVLRSVLWAITRAPVRATRWASMVGQVVAGSFMLAGVTMILGLELPFLGGGPLNGIWLGLIGIFLWSAASQSYRRATMQGNLEGVPVRSIMNTDVQVVSAHLGIDALVQERIQQSNNQAFIVADSGRMVGLVTLEDVVKVPEEARRSTTVRHIMTPSENLAVIAPDEDASQALEQLEAGREVRPLPVVRGNSVVGLLRRRDIRRWLQLHPRR